MSQGGSAIHLGRIQRNTYTQMKTDLCKSRFLNVLKVYLSQQTAKGLIDSYRVLNIARFNKVLHISYLVTLTTFAS